MDKFYGQFEPQVDRYIYERYFRDCGIKGVFVECGAFDGLTENSCKFFEASLGWRGFNIEPVPWVYDKLCENRPEAVNLNFALSDKIGKGSFKAVDHPVFGVDCTNGSLAHTDKHLSMLEEGGCKFIDVPVSLLTWSEFISRNNISHVDLLVLDVEGHELSVIEGMNGSKVLPDVLCIEVGHLDFEQIRLKLSLLGYVYDVSSHVNAFFVKNDLVALFAFRASHFGRLSTPAYEGDAISQVAPSDSVLSSGDVAELNAQKQALEAELAHVRDSLNQLRDLYNSIVSSKAWRVIERIRRIVR